jgi:hypothetical protein
MNHRDAETQREELSELSGKIIGFCIGIHRKLGSSSVPMCLGFSVSLW